MPWIAGRSASRWWPGITGVTPGWSGCGSLPIRRVRGFAAFACRRGRGDGIQEPGVRLTVEGLGEALLPAILHWDQNHYVVLYRIRSRRKGVTYRVADPAYGLREVTREELLHHWATTSAGEESAGVALLLEPTPRFFREEMAPDRAGGLRFFGKYLRPYRRLLLQLMAGFLTASLISLLFLF